MPFWRNSRWNIIFSNISWGEGMRWLMNEDIFCRKPNLVWVSDLLTSPFVYHKLLSCGDWCSLNCTSLDTSDFKISNWCSKHQSLSVFATRLQVIWVSEKNHDGKHLHVLSFAFNWSAFQYHLAIIAQNTALLCAVFTLTHTHTPVKPLTSSQMSETNYHCFKNIAILPQIGFVIFCFALHMILKAGQN